MDTITDIVDELNELSSELDALTSYGNVDEAINDLDGASHKLMTLSSHCSDLADKLKDARNILS